MVRLYTTLRKPLEGNLLQNSALQKMRKPNRKYPETLRYQTLNPKP